MYHSRSVVPDPSSRPLVVVISGVSGSGKTTVGRALATDLGWSFYDADDLHSTGNIERMRQGLALDDAMREPWLRRVRAVIEDAVREGRGAVVACSALKAKYRRILSEGLEPVRFVFLEADHDLLQHRLATRTGHFAGAALIDSQLAALEPPSSALNLDASRPVAELITAIRSHLFQRR
jgi:gluconokinase